MGKAVQDNEDHRIRTAIVIADSFDHRFTPITLETPRALIPLLGQPTINYTLEFLVSGGMKKIYLFCCAHAQKIVEYIEDSWVSTLDDVEVMFVVSQTAVSIGDALREIHNKFEDEIKADFLLVQGDVVSNMKLDDVLERHQLRRKKRPQAIMTSLLKKAAPCHRTRAGEDATIIAVDKHTNMLLHFDNSTQPKLCLDAGIFKEHHAVEFRYDLIDCNIDICSPEVLFLFQDNFDYKDLRRDFINGVLGSELLGYELYTDVIDQEYAARVRGLNTYAAVSRDVARRWAYPMVPDSNITGTTSFKYNHKSDFYLEVGVILSSTATISRSSVLGQGTSVGNGSSVHQCVVGRNCSIGDNVKLSNCFIWDNVHIADNCMVSNSILCHNVRLFEKTTVEEGCVLSFNVSVGPNVTLPRETKLTTIDHFSDEEDEEFFSNYGEDSPLEDYDVGEGLSAKLWVFDEGDTTNSLNYSVADQVNRFRDDLGLEEEFEADTIETSGIVVEVPGPTEGLDEFQRDIYEIVFTGFYKEHEVSLIALEVKTRCLAHHRPFVDGAIGFLLPLLDLLADRYDAPPSKAKSFVAKFKELVAKWQELFSEFIPLETDEVDFVYSVCALALERDDLFKHTLMMIDTFYENEVITEEAILKWADELEASDDADDKRILKQCGDFIEWLRDNEEEEEEEEEEDD